MVMPYRRRRMVIGLRAICVRPVPLERRVPLVPLERRVLLEPLGRREHLVLRGPIVPEICETFLALMTMAAMW